jgi:hypothetical protein
MIFLTNKLDLDAVIAEPTNKDKLEDWQKASKIRKLFYKGWKDKTDKIIIINNVKYELKPLIK